MINPEISKWVRITLIVLTIFIAVEVIDALKSFNDPDSFYNSISVTGEGEAVSIPDTAVFSFSVSADGDTVDEAQDQVTEKMNAILDELDDRDVDDKDIKTTNYSIQPKYRFETINCITTPCPPSRRVQDGYTVSHNVSVKVRETDEAGEILSLMGKMGVSNLSGLSLTVDDPDQVTEEARADAIAEAKEKAKRLADDLGVKLVRVVSFYDNTGGVPYYAESFGADTEILRASASPTPNIPVGENKVVVNVTVVYEIR